MAKNELPPDLCVEIALWDRFGWGPLETETISLQKMREIFIVLEQQRVSRDAVENLGKPSEDKFNQMLSRRKIEKERKDSKQNP